MKKTTLLLTLLLTLCLLLAACGEKPTSGGNDTPDHPQQTHAADNNTDWQDETEEDGSVKAPITDWWNLYTTRNKENTLVIQVSNPNDVPLQFTYDVVFYKNNEEVKRHSYWSMTCVPANDVGLIWANVDIPSAADADSVALENIEASQFDWEVLDYTITESGTDENKRCFNITFPQAPRGGEYWSVLYNDNNHDGEVQKEEFVEMGMFAHFIGIYEAEGELYIPTPDDYYNYTDYKFYCSPFIIP